MISEIAIVRLYRYS